MARKLIVIFAILGLAAAFAGSIPGVASFRVTLRHPSVMNGTELKAGEYRLTLGDSKVTLIQDKQTFVVNATIENGENKFDTTVVRYSIKDDKAVIGEIRLGGTKTIVRIQ